MENLAREFIAKLRALFSNPKKTIPLPFEPGSNILFDLHCAVLSANLRVERGQETDFGAALQSVFQDFKAKSPNSGATLSGNVLCDWNWRRGRAETAH
jgi:hypothetical protein